MLFDWNVVAAPASVQDLQLSAPLTLSGEGLWVCLVSSGKCTASVPGAGPSPVGAALILPPQSVPAGHLILSRAPLSLVPENACHLLCVQLTGQAASQFLTGLRELPFLAKGGSCPAAAELMGRLAEDNSSHSRARSQLAYALLCLHWFNPTVFLLFLLVNRDMELLCDERVLSRRATSSKRAYALTLLEMEAARSAAPTMSCFRMTGIEERILTMKNTKKNTPLTRLVAGSLVAASCFAMISAVPACADDKVFIVKAENALVMWENTFVSSEDSLVLSADTAEDSAYSYVVYGEEPSASESDALPVEWWTVDEFESYMAQTRKDLEEMAQTGERGYTSTDGWFTWTQEKVEETMAIYDEMLAELKRGVKISKPFGSLSEGTDIVISKGPDSVSTHTDSTLMIDADTTLYLEKDGGAVFHATPDCTAIPESSRDALEAFSADLLEQSPYSLLNACPICFELHRAKENGETK